MNMLIWVAVAVAFLLIGREAGKYLFSKTSTGVSRLPLPKGIVNARRSAQSLAISLREMGLKRIPMILEEYAVGDIPDLLEGIQDLAKLMASGNETILKELDNTFDRVLDVKIRTPEGRAVVKAKIEEIEQGLLRAAALAAPIAEKVAIAAIVAPK